MMNKTTTARLLGAALLVGAVQAQAAITWTFDSYVSGGGTSGYTTIDTTSASQTAGGIKTTAQGWSNTNNGVTTGTGSSGPLGHNGFDQNGNVSNSEVNAINGYKLETAYLTVYDGGIGTKNRDASTDSRYGDWEESNQPEHAVDNNQRFDSVLFSFDSDVDLNTVSLGYWSNDSDISVLRFDNGNGANSTTNIAGKTYAELLDAGWNLVSYTDAVGDVKTKNLAGDTFSSYWLIGAANPLLGTANTDGKDHVKILALAGEKYVPPCTPGTPGCGGGNTEVPEPGTLLLLGAGLVGMTRMTRRKAA